MLPPTPHAWCPGVEPPLLCPGGSTHLDKAYRPTDVLSPLPGATDVLDVLYHVSHVVISAWRCFALIIHNSGDNHAHSGH